MRERPFSYWSPASRPSNEKRPGGSGDRVAISSGSDAHMIAAVIVPGRLNRSARFLLCLSIIGPLHPKPASCCGLAAPLCTGCEWLAYCGQAQTLLALVSAAAGGSCGICHRSNYVCALRVGVDCFHARRACAEHSGDNSGGRGTSSSGHQPEAIRSALRRSLSVNAAIS